MIALHGALALALLGVPALAGAQDSQVEDWLRNPAMGNYKAYAEFKMAHYAAARHIWETLAGLGNADALFNLGVLAEDGLGEPQDLRKAEALYLAGAEVGGFKAQYRLGLLYSTGGILQQDLVRARHYLGLAAAHGDQDARSRLQALAQADRPLSLFEQAEALSGSGRHSEAALRYQEAMAGGEARAHTRLGWMHEAGRGVERDLDRAARLFRVGAQRGDAEAQYALAVMYRTGRGLEKDRTLSLQWLQRAAEQNYPPAVAAWRAEQDNAQRP
ncbi:MAG: sel1 repeat family protein [Rhodoferax sp.]|nr:sel1 repeat family protein [Rhodoferax sp.]